MEEGRDAMGRLKFNPKVRWVREGGRKESTGWLKHTKERLMTEDGRGQRTVLANISFALKYSKEGGRE